MPEETLTREQFLKRCETIYDAGLARPEVLRLLERWTDFVMRLEGGQFNYAVDFLRQEQKRTEGFYPGRTLAGDKDGYDLIQLAAILTHPCQLCGEDLKAWWTRVAFCTHKGKTP